MSSKQKPKEEVSLLNRLPPNDAGAELACLGAIFESNGACLPECQIKINPEHFYDLVRRAIYGQALVLFEKQSMVDFVSLDQSLRDTNSMASATFSEVSSDAMKACVSLQNLPVWLESLCSKWRARRGIQIGTELVMSAFDNPSEIDPDLALADTQLMDLIAGQSNTASRAAKAVAMDTINEMERRQQLGGKLSGLGTGYPDLDKITNGLQRGQQTILGARPSIGKSALSGNLVENICLRNKVPTLLISLEMEQNQFMSRMSGSYARVLADNVKTGGLTERDFPKLKEFYSALSGSPLYFIDCVVKRLTCAEISAAIRIHSETHGVQFVVVDYLQIVRPTKQRQKRTDEVAEISSTLRRAAVATNTALLAIAQLNRESDKEKPRPPKLTDLRECGQIEQDADCVLLLHRTKTDQPESAAAFLNVAKQRDGANGTVGLTWLPEYCRFESASRIANYEN